ncbi:hypothetical protein SNE40_014184 [Patella caerulea]|uniref:Reverse transcriptase domain-containing protein n=1 Tax=Patella caerulea TaxID=87958 RepID=A0AAN8JGH7_PATCE
MHRVRRLSLYVTTWITWRILQSFAVSLSLQNGYPAYIAYSIKKDSSRRVCLDPRHLNQALRSPHYRIPTVEEVTHHFAGNSWFSKLDAKMGYWAVQLDETSQPLTTFQTPFGRYCFQRLPFGLSVSQDIFQMKVDKILDQASRWSCCNCR